MTQITNTASSMASEKFENAFVVADMTSLRYAVPFIKACKRLLEKEVVLLYGEGNGKYNSLSTWKSRLLEIAKENDFMLQQVSENLRVARLFCVENVTLGVEHQKCYSFQHGFDYTILHKNKSSSTYLVSENHFQKHLDSLDIKSIVQPFPVIFWDWNFNVQFAKQQEFLTDHPTVLMFYPEEGINELFKQVYDEISRRGYKIYVKQRAKNQSMPSYIENPVYDAAWYPTESVTLPISADFCIGFGTSAYTDLIHMGRDFIDLCVPSYSKNYYKPSAGNFHSIAEDFFEKFCTTDTRSITMNNKIDCPFDDQQIANFLEACFND